MDDNLSPFRLSFFNFFKRSYCRAVQLINNIKTVKKKRDIVCVTGTEEGSKVLAIKKLILIV